MKKQYRWNVKRIASLLFCICAVFRISGSPVFAEDSAENLSYPSPELESISEEMQSTDADREDLERPSQCGDCGSPLEADGSCAVCSPMVPEMEQVSDSSPCSEPLEELGFVDEPVPSEDLEAAQNPVAPVDAIDPAIMDTSDSEITVRNPPNYYIAIPVTICRISPDEKNASLRIDVNCESGLGEGDCIELSFSSANDMTLTCGELDRIDYSLRNVNGESVANHAAIASFYGTGSVELSLEVNGTPSYAGEYKDVLTFTTAFIPGEADSIS